MRTHLMLAVLAVTMAPGAATAQVNRNQDAGGIRTETQDRLRSGDDPSDVLNWLGLLGLLGLAGLRRGHSEDSYHPTNVE